MPDCIFCKIVRGELPSYNVYEDEYVFAFLDIHPVNPGHTLVIPKKHSRNIFEIAPAEWAHVTEAARKLAGIIEKSVDAVGANLMMNNREQAGQVVDHTHVHIIPRFAHDNHRHWAHSSYKEGEAGDVLKKIRENLQS